MDPAPSAVRPAVLAALRTLSTSEDAGDVLAALGSVSRYLRGAAAPASPGEQEEFAAVHSAAFLRCLVGKLSPDWLELTPDGRLEQLWATFFLDGPAGQAFLALVEGIGAAAG